jgi:hypothetical protein
MGNQFLPVLIQGVSSLRECFLDAQPTGNQFCVCSLNVHPGKFTNPHSIYAQHMWK